MLDFNSPKGYFIHLTKCALKGLTPCEKPDGVAFEEIFEIARKQKVSNLLWDVIMELENKIIRKTHERINENQHEYFLREQLHVIEDELGDKDGIGAEVEEFRKKIEKNYKSSSRNMLQYTIVYVTLLIWS